MSDTICDRCGKQKWEHQSVEKFCPFISTFRAAARSLGEPTQDDARTWYAADASESRRIAGDVESSARIDVPVGLTANPTRVGSPDETRATEQHVAKIGARAWYASSTVVTLGPALVAAAAHDPEGGVAILPACDYSYLRSALHTSQEQTRCPECEGDRLIGIEGAGWDGSTKYVDCSCKDGTVRGMVAALRAELAALRQTHGAPDLIVGRLLGIIDRARYVPAHEREELRAWLAARSSHDAPVSETEKT